MKKILLLLFIGIMLQNCKKAGNLDRPINNALKAAFNYKPGTYWIYRDSLSGRVDSFFVTSNTPLDYSTPNAGSIETIKIAISEYNIAPTPLISDTFSWQIFLQGNDFDLISLNYIFPEGLIFAPVVNYPYRDTLFEDGDIYTNFIDTGFTLNIFPGYTLNGNSFSNVAIINHICPASFSDWFYVSPDVGIFKMNIDQEIDSTYHVWELQRWHIVK